MKFDITWTITAIIAISSFLSPIAVAIINNIHQVKIRKIELEHDECLRQMDLYQQLSVRQSDIYYADKKSAFLEFMACAGAYPSDKQSLENYASLHSSIDKALLFCHPTNQALLQNFLQYVDQFVFCRGYTLEERKQYSSLLNEVAISLNKELNSSKPIINCECGKH